MRADSAGLVRRGAPRYALKTAEKRSWGNLGSSNYFWGDAIAARSAQRLILAEYGDSGGGQKKEGTKTNRRREPPKRSYARNFPKQKILDRG